MGVLGGGPVAVLCGGAGAGSVSFSTSEVDSDVEEVAADAFLAGGSVGAFSTGLGLSSMALVKGAGSGSGPGSTASFSSFGWMSALYWLL